MWWVVKATSEFIGLFFVVFFCVVCFSLDVYDCFRYCFEYGLLLFLLVVHVCDFWVLNKKSAPEPDSLRSGFGNLGQQIVFTRFVSD